MELTIMFIHLLTRSEKEVLVDLLIRLTHSDNTFDKHEMDFLSNIQLKHEIPLYNNPNLSVKQLCAEITQDRSRVTIFMELLHLAYIDGDYCELEKEFLNEVAKNFAITAEKFIEIERWVKSGIVWKENGDVILTSLNTVTINHY
jgi:hypothetical protein